MENGYYFNPVGMYPSSGFDYRCLLNAMKTPNALDPSFRGGSAQSTQTIQASQPTAQNTQVQYVSEPKNHTTRNWIIGIGAAAAIIAAGRYGYKNGPATEGFVKRIVEGIKTGVGKIGKATTEKAAESAKEAVTQGKCTIAEVTDRLGRKHTVVTMPGEKNIISAIANKKNPGRSAVTATNQLAAINEEVKVGSLADRIIEPAADAKNKISKFKEGNEMRSFVLSDVITIKEPGFRNKKQAIKLIGVRGKDGNIITTVVDAKSGKKLLAGDIVPETYADLETKVKDIFAGKLGDGVKYSDFDQVIIRNTNKETGLVATIKAEKGNEKLLSATTDRFALDSDDVRAFSHNNQAFKDALKNYKDKKFDGLTVLRKDVPIVGGKTFTIDNDGNIIAMKYKDKATGKVISLDATKDKKLFDAKCEEFEKDIEAAKKLKSDRWTNVVYELPS